MLANIDSKMLLLQKACQQQAEMYLLIQLLVGVAVSSRTGQIRDYLQVIFNIM